MLKISKLISFYTFKDTLVLMLSGILKASNKMFFKMVFQMVFILKSLATYCVKTYIGMW